MSLTSISNRLTPSVPLEITFGAQPTAVGRKFTTIFAHRAAAGGSGLDYQVLNVVNVGDPFAVKAEVDAFAGANSEASKMAVAFVKANSAVGRSNYPAFRICLLPFAETSFGPADEAFTAVRNLRTDMFVSPYAASVGAQITKLKDFVAFISGPDRDLVGQFGSFFTVGSLESLAAAVLYNINQRSGIVAYLQDTNTALVNTTGDTTNGSATIANVASVVGVNEGAVVTGPGIPANTTVVQVLNGSLVLSAAATATAAGVALAIQNLQSQSVQEVAAAHAAGMMASAFPYNPLQNVEIGGLVAPRKKSDIIYFDPAGASEQALNAGLSPMTVLPNGGVGYIRTRTTFTTLPGPIPATAYFDWQDIVVLMDFREVCFQVAQNPPFNNNPGGTKASTQIASKLKDEVLREAFDFEADGAFQNVKLLSKFFQIEISTSSRGRFDFKIPVDVVPGLYVIAGNIQAVSDLSQFTV